MAYDSIVCVKQVPDTANITAEAMKEDGTVNRAALPTIFNPEDLHALETALEIRDRVRRHGDGRQHGPAQGGRRAPRLPVPRGRSGDPADRPPRRRQRHPGHQLHPRPRPSGPSAGTTSCSAAGRRSTATRPRSARNAPRSSAFRRSPIWRSWSSIHDRRGPHPPEHRPRLGDRRGEAAGAGHGARDGQRAAAAGGQAGDADEAGAGARRSGRRSEGRHARRRRRATRRRDRSAASSR